MTPLLTHADGTEVPLNTCIKNANGLTAGRNPIVKAVSGSSTGGDIAALDSVVPFRTPLHQGDVSFGNLQNLVGCANGATYLAVCTWKVPRVIGSHPQPRSLLHTFVVNMGILTACVYRIADSLDRKDIILSVYLRGSVVMTSLSCSCQAKGLEYTTLRMRDTRFWRAPDF